MNVFPNPVRDQLTIHVTGANGKITNLFLMNQMGQIVKTLDLKLDNTSTVQLPVNQFADGLYHSSLVVDGRILRTEKVMIHR